MLAGVPGGYDERLAENREHLEELRELAEKIGVADKVSFVPSFTADQRTALLVACLAVLYTPQVQQDRLILKQPGIESAVLYELPSTVVSFKALW